MFRENSSKSQTFLCDQLSVRLHHKIQPTSRMTLQTSPLKKKSTFSWLYRIKNYGFTNKLFTAYIQAVSASVCAIEHSLPFLLFLSDSILSIASAKICFTSST